MTLGAGDCERLHDGLVAQPVNTASALAYVAVGAWLLGRRQAVFGLAVVAAGVGSVDYHGPGSPAARLLHDGGLYAVVGLVAWHEATRRVGQARRAGTGAPWAGLAPGRRAAYRAALAADGESVIGNVGQIGRGYERIDERLRALGANIERTG